MDSGNDISYVYRLENEIRQLREDNQRLKLALEEASIRLKQDSTNSSKPPSSDWNKSPKENPPPKKKGPPLGHPAHHRPLISDDQVDRLHVCSIDQCPRCGSRNLVQIDGNRLHQQVELVDLKRTVTQYQLLRYRCLDCQKLSYTPLPEGVSASSFGPQLKATVAMLLGRYHLSHRESIDLLAKVCGITMAVGMPSKIQKESNRVLAATFDTLLGELRSDRSPLYSDETGWYHQNQRAWAWVLSDSRTTLFSISPSRSRQTFQDLSLMTENRSLVSDRYSAYLSHQGPHQLCLAHIKREFKAISQGSGYVGWCGKKLLESLQHVFALQKQFKKGLITMRSWKQRSRYQFSKIEDFLADALISAPEGHPLRGKLRGLSRDSPLFSTYLDVGCEPTNNRSERALRRLVIWRKRSFGSQSCSGQQFLCSMMTVWRTFEQRGFDFFSRLIKGFVYRDHTHSSLDLLTL